MKTAVLKLQPNPDGVDSVWSDVHGTSVIQSLLQGLLKGRWKPVKGGAVFIVHDNMVIKIDRDRITLKVAMAK